MLGSFAMLLSSMIRQLENFAGIMNFIIFPMFFLSSSLYPLWKMKESSYLLYQICAFNPFTHVVETIRFTLYGEINILSCTVVLGSVTLFLMAAIYAYNPKRAITVQKSN